MPRQSRSGGARRSAPSGPAPGSSRGAHTAAAPPPQRASAPANQQRNSQVPAQQQPASAGGGFLGNIASTAAGVAAGHGISQMLFGGSGHNNVEAAPAQEAYQQQPYQQESGARCEFDAKNLTQCLSATNNDASACSYYIEQLKACQQAASQY